MFVASILNVFVVLDMSGIRFLFCKLAFVGVGCDGRGVPN